MDDIRYLEYKILLRPERFFHPSQFEVYWHKIVRIAGDHGIGVTTAENGFKRHVREVLFYDTPDFDLYRNAFILRRRTFYDDGWPAPEHELTFKFRHPDLDEAAKVDVTPRLSGEAKIKFKCEILPLASGIGDARHLYSHNCVLMTPGLVLDQGLDRIAGVFPALAPLCAGEKPVSLVNNLAVEEVEVTPGRLDFGRGMTAKATVAVWRDRASERTLVGEFAFQARFAHLEDIGRKAMKRAADFFLAVQRGTEEWIQLGTTKTALVYGFAGRPVGGHE
ncbi:hypothetical protein [Methylobrevis pamukkalensis]|uniref:Uncharacterized protein n=1 Tax=Methylobrevis pamukkalensis TaxID=1439726 RepID=A0A1E3GWW1_9HYPH|nr:hypothetical protein [Methylobrevis pamukkalensis]ODN68537.1 hypothetical protein A6302_04172 [Methylobrevis pamukkalensis]